MLGYLVLNVFTMAKSQFQERQTFTSRKIACLTFWWTLPNFLELFFSWVYIACHGIPHCVFLNDTNWRKCLFFSRKVKYIRSNRLNQRRFVLNNNWCLFVIFTIAHCIYSNHKKILFSLMITNFDKYIDIYLSSNKK